jgi:hypothetical protein
MKKPIRIFDDFANGQFAELVGDHGFFHVECDSSKDGSSHIFRKDDLYIKLSVNLHPRDAPNHCVVSLGEGNYTWPERDWNAVALWRIIADHPDGDSGATEYTMQNPEVDLDKISERIVRDVSTFGGDFLNGDAAGMRKARAKTNRDREPYKHYANDGFGILTLSYDSESSELKQRFS